MSGLRLNTLRRTTALALLGVGVISLFQFLLVWFVRYLPTYECQLVTCRKIPPDWVFNLRPRITV